MNEGNAKRRNRGEFTHETARSRWLLPKTHKWVYDIKRGGCSTFCSQKSINQCNHILLIYYFVSPDYGDAKPDSDRIYDGKLGQHAANGKR